MLIPSSVGISRVGTERLPYTEHTGQEISADAKKYRRIPAQRWLLVKKKVLGILSGWLSMWQFLARAAICRVSSDELSAGPADGLEPEDSCHE
jgi:hypothetical protein